MDDLVAGGIGAWLGNRWFGRWYKRHPVTGFVVFVAGTVLAIGTLLVLS